LAVITYWYWGKAQSWHFIKELLAPLFLQM